MLAVSMGDLQPRRGQLLGDRHSSSKTLELATDPAHHEVLGCEPYEGVHSVDGVGTQEGTSTWLAIRL